jgi:hypothetical protein
MDIFTYVPQHRVFVCCLCQQAVLRLIWEARKQFTILLQHTKILPDSAIPTPVLTKTGRVPTRVPPFR